MKSLATAWALGVLLLILAAIYSAVSASGSEFDERPQTRLVRIAPTNVESPYRSGDWDSVSIRYLPAPARALTSLEGQHAQRREALSRNANGTFWDFAPEQPWQSAAVRVTAGRYGGSGTMVATSGNLTLIVTNYHVVDQGGGRLSPTITAHLRDGRTAIAHHMIATPREDVAVYGINTRDLPTVAVSSENAPPGATICVMGFGGPRMTDTDFRPFVARTVPTDRAIAIDAPTISGDSGSGMIWENVLVGVNWGGDMPRQLAGVSGGDAIPLVYPATSSADAMFLNRFLTQACQPYGIRPIVGRPGYLIPRGDQLWERQPRQPPSQQQQQFPGPEQFYRPQQPQCPPGQPCPPAQPSIPQQPITDPVPNQPITQPQACEPCDCSDEKIRGLIACEIASMELTGPRGEKGEQGLPGKDGMVTDDHLKTIIASVVGSIKNDASMRGADGKDGRDGKDAEIDLDELAIAVIARLPPIQVESYTYDRESKQYKLRDSESYPYPGPLKIRYLPTENESASSR